MDKTEWEIQLRDAASHSLITVLNTAGIEAHDDPYSNPWYGEDPRKPMHTDPVPSGHEGRSVYVQVIARRWWPTPYGASVMLDSGYMVAESGMIDALGNMLGNAEHAVLLDQWFQQVLDYCDQYKAEHGWLPQTHRWLFSPQQQSVFESRYFRESTINGNTVLSEIPPPNPVPSKAGRKPLKYTRTVSSAEVVSISPNPVRADGSITLRLRVSNNADITLRIYNSAGSAVGDLWLGPAREVDELPIVLSGLNLASGSYSLAVIEEPGGAIVDRSFITVVK